ncbi:hypothetical protein D9Q98_010455 [Chlorella vulgaris]|uniref:Uncharacterized protein n=1 Tax=Chlorella vulgaris TaxID=3077 RepID=A0A9D4TT70_CHLVU|nr:hypothetical protein D9Q98_010455 [Chlorella vulgaris]
MTGGASTPAGGGGGFNAWWQSLKGHPQATNVHTNVRTTVQRLKKAKWGMPVDVKIDFLRPTIEMLNDSLQQAYRQLPPRLQEAAPQIGVALASGLIVFAIQQRRLSNQRQANLAMQQELVLVKRERNELRQRVSTLKANRAPRTEVEARLATAVAEASNAAAAAADAAARAATACIFQPARHELGKLAPSHESTLASK